MFSPATKEDAATTLRDAKNTAYGAKADLSRVGEEASISLSDKAANAGRKVHDFVNAADGAIHDFGDKVSTEVHENPVRSSVISLGVGFLLGALLLRR